MPSLNKVQLIGHLGGDPKIIYTQSGSAVTNFTMATSSKYKDKSGELIENTEWHRIVAFGKLAEICGEYLTKGKLIYVEGRLQTKSWDDKEGIKRYTTEIICQIMQMLGGKGEEKPKPKSNKEEVKEECPF